MCWLSLFHSLDDSIRQLWSKDFGTPFYIELKTTPNERPRGVQVGGSRNTDDALGDVLVRRCKHQGRNAYSVLMRKLRGLKDDKLVVLNLNEETQASNACNSA